MQVGQMCKEKPYLVRLLLVECECRETDDLHVLQFVSSGVHLRDDQFVVVFVFLTELKSINARSAKACYRLTLSFITDESLGENDDAPDRRWVQTADNDRTRARKIQLGRPSACRRRFRGSSCRRGP